MSESKNGHVKVKAVPDGYHTVTPALSLKDTAAAIDFYKKAFGAEEVCRMPGPGGQGVMHAEIKIGNSAIMLGDEWPDYPVRSPESVGATTGSLHIYVEDVDAAFQKAVSAGATASMPPADMFWGDRYAKVVDPFGHFWGLATHIEDVSPEEMARRGQEWMAQMAAQPA